MKKNKIYLIATILLILIIYKTNFLRSLHDLVILSYDDRVSNTYGFCDREGIGYVNFIKKNFNIEGKIIIRNSLKQNNYNSGEWSVYNSNFSEKSEFDYLILINFEKFKKEFDLNNFQILDNYQNCYYVR